MSPHQICDREYDEAVSGMFARFDRDQRLVAAVERGAWFVLGFCGVGLGVVAVSLPWLLA
ncbi:hypothetical protein [Caenimonas soli]|uniref:hypothetical protein n=1 Tax=Caenimonas soli TaxID=2735555 RepID=UPI001556A444|nr:hypothetical protein [Caenimonas soli]NPC57017.1 hypothetical protein [Caenimonas soli]